jgi:hypothetical protein
MMKRPTAMDILGHLGMIGSPISTGLLVPRAMTPAAQQNQRDEFFEYNKVADPDVWSKYAQIMKRPSTLESQLQLWDEMATWDLITAALVQIVDEVLQTDNMFPKAIWYESNNDQAAEATNDMLVQLGADALLPSQVWNVASLGNHFEKLDYARGEGIRNMSCVHPFEIRRYWLERTRQCIGFKWKGHEPNKEDIFVLPDNTTPVERVAISNGQVTDDLYYPWDFMHMRRIFRLRSSEHGEPLYDEAQGIYKKLRLAIDQMVVHRAQVQPDRYVVNIDTQDLPPTEQMKVVNRWKNAMRTRQTFGQGQAVDAMNTPDDYRAFYNPWALDTIFYLPQPRGVKHAIEKIAGTPTVPDVFDIELLIDLFFSIIGMPKTWFGLGQQDAGSGNPPSGKALLAQDMRFLRKVKALRRPLINSYTWLGYFHLLLRGIDISQVTLEAKMPDIGGLEDQIKLDLIRSQAEVLQILGDVMDQYSLPKEAWVDLIFKRYMHLPDEVVNIFLTALPPEVEPAVEPGAMESQRRAAPRTQVLLAEVSCRLMANPHTVYNVRQQVRRYNSLTEDMGKQKIIHPSKILQKPIIKPGDRCGYAFNEGEASILHAGTSATTGSTILQESAVVTPAATNGNGKAAPGQEPPVSTAMPDAWRRYIKPMAKL